MSPPPLSLLSRFVLFIVEPGCSCASWRGIRITSGYEDGRRRERAREGGGTPFLPSDPVIDFLFIISEFHVDVVHCTIKDPLEDSSCMAIYRKCKANPYSALPAIVAVLIPIMMMSVN
jgi:hypothetical protein